MSHALRPAALFFQTSSVALCLCLLSFIFSFFFFFFNDTATTEIYTLSLHDALPILDALGARVAEEAVADDELVAAEVAADARSEEHTSELQSHSDLVCRLLLEKKKKKVKLAKMMKD